MNNKSLSDIGTEIGELCEEKNEAYGDSFAKAGEILAALYPNGVSPWNYTDMLGIIRVLDKLFRIATRKDAFGESPWKDIAGYGILGVYNDLKGPEVQREPNLVFPMIEMNCLCLGDDKEDQPSESEVNEELRRIEQKVLDHVQFHGLPPFMKEVATDRACRTCIHDHLEPSDMPCKKCIDKPFLPHYRERMTTL